MGFIGWGVLRYLLIARNLSSVYDTNMLDSCLLNIMLGLFNSFCIIGFGCV